MTSVAEPVVTTATGHRGAPFLKFVGGKSRLLPELLSRAPLTYNRYYEPFVGGGALFFALAPRDAVLNDLNFDLMTCYREVRDDVEEVIDLLEYYRKNHDKEMFYLARQKWNADGYRTEAGRAAAFIYLNKTCFNGIWRVNRKGEFNVPMGDYKNPQILDADGLRAASAALRAGRCALMNLSYAEALSGVAAGDFVYFDPPYEPVSRTSSFTAYAASGFGQAHQRGLRDTFRQLVARGVKCMLSNSDVPFIRELYDGFRIDTVQCGRSVSSKTTKRGKVNEVIVMGGY